jgi:CRAL/TRIO domain
MMKQEESPPPPRKTSSRRGLLFRNKTKKESAAAPVVVPLPAVTAAAAVLRGTSSSTLLSLGSGRLLDDGVVQFSTKTTTTTTTTTIAADSTYTTYSSKQSLTTTTYSCNNYSDISFESTTTTTRPNWSNDSMDTTCELWQVDATERELLVELGRRVADIQHDQKNTPDELIRFLHAKSGDLIAAERMFRTSIEWRRTVQADTALDRPPPLGLLEAIPGAILAGTDHEGDPVFVSRVGTFDAIGAYKKFGRDDIVHHCVWIRELASRGEWRVQREQAMGRPMKQLLIIEDLQGIPLTKLISSPAILSLYGEMMRIDQENYPDASKKIIVIRTPALFRMGWNLVKPFFDKYVVEKMVFCGYHDYETVLSQYVDLKVLPPDLLPGIGQGRAEVGMPSRFDGGGGSVGPAAATASR